MSSKKFRALLKQLVNDYWIDYMTDTFAELDQAETADEDMWD
jgi:hypothetical protein